MGFKCFIVYRRVGGGNDNAHSAPETGILEYSSHCLKRCAGFLCGNVCLARFDGTEDLRHAGNFDDSSRFDLACFENQDANCRSFSLHNRFYMVGYQRGFRAVCIGLQRCQMENASAEGLVETSDFRFARLADRRAAGADFRRALCGGRRGF